MVTEIFTETVDGVEFEIIVKEYSGDNKREVHIRRE